MNIAAAMDVLNIKDLDRTARHALLVLACHADRATATATVSVERLAGELGVSYEVARRAVHRALTAGYLEAQPVDNHPGKTRTLHLTYDASDVSRYDASVDDIRRDAPKDTPPVTYRRIFKEKRRSAPPLAHRKAASNGAVDKHPDSCACGGTGWLPVAGGTTVTQCLEVAK